MPEPENDSEVEFTSRWAQVLALRRTEGGYTEEQYEKFSKALESLFWEYWEASYAYLRCVRPLNRISPCLTYFEALLSSYIDAPACKRFNSRFRLFLRAALGEYVRSGLHLISGLGAGLEIPRAILPFEEQLQPLLAERLSPEEHFDRSWDYALEMRTLARLSREWDTSGKQAIRDHLFPFLKENPSVPELREITGALMLSEEEVMMALSRFRNSFRNLLRQRVSDTVARADEVELEWKELFPEAVEDAG